MKQLIKDYKRRLATVKEEIAKINESGNDAEDITLIRLGTKASEYRTFIVDLERIERNVQPDTTPKLVSLIDFSTLRTQKKTLIEIIDDMEKRGVEPERVSDLDGILNLIDCIQDYAVDVMGLNPIDVYDFDLEELREDIVKPTKTIVLCKECNTDDVIIRGKDKGFCMICAKDVETYTTELKSNAKVIGYQVVGMSEHENDGQLHPEMLGSFALYSLKQAQKMLKSDNTMYTNEWIIVSIWSGDIEEPTMMFRGDPDNNHKK